VARVRIPVGDGSICAALLLNGVAGMPMPPIVATRVVASLSVFAGARALVWFVVLIARRRASRHPVAAWVALTAVAAVSIAITLAEIISSSA